jgi:hypothetical protein
MFKIQLLPIEALPAAFATSRLSRGTKFQRAVGFRRYAGFYAYAAEPFVDL